MASTDPALVGLGLVVVAGVAASWLAWRLDLPSILFLLVAGILVGPVTGWVDPDALLGQLLFPVVSFSVGIILFEGGLNLRTVEAKEIGGVVRNLVTVGVLVTWALIAVSAHLLVDLELGLALLLGAIFTVTGPTVIMPLLHHLRPRERVSNVLKWEGIIIDPIGAILAVLVFEWLIAGGPGEAATSVATTIGTAALAGGLLGVAGAALLYVVLRRHWVPDILRSPVTLGMVIAVFTASEMIQSESGLVAAVVMGAVLVNQEDIAKRHIVEFKENLRVLLISFLFVILGARMDPSAIEVLSAESFLFLGVVILVVRPLAVLVSSLGSPLDWRERAFLAGVAPRGVVAAAISSVFAIELADIGYAGADRLVPLTFFLIIGTVAIYGVLAGPLGRLLGVVPERHDGVLVVGAHRWARDAGAALVEAGVPVLLVDKDPHDLFKAEARGLSTYQGNPVHEAVLEEMNLAGIGHFVALARDDAMNALSILHFLEEFDRADAYQIPPTKRETRGEKPIPKELSGRLLFQGDLTWREVEDLVDRGWRFTHLPLGEEPEPDLPEDIFPFAVVREGGDIAFFTEDEVPEARGGDVLVALVPEDMVDEETETPVPDEAPKPPEV